MFILHTNLFLMVNLTLSFKLMLQPLAGEAWGKNREQAGDEQYPHGGLIQMPGKISSEQSTERGFWWCLAGLAKAGIPNCWDQWWLLHWWSLKRKPFWFFQGARKFTHWGKSLSFMQRLYKIRGFSERAINFIFHSWRQSSQKQYRDAYIRKWLLFWTKRQADPICPTVSVAVDFLTSLYDGRLSYTSINSVRCDLSTILESPASGYSYSNFGEHPDVKRLVKGIFQSRATLPLHCKTWDVNLVLHLVHWLTMGNSPEF